MTDSKKPKASKKAKEKQKTFDKEAFLRASMTMAAETGWNSVTPAKVVERMGLGQDVLPAYLKTPFDILVCFENHITEQVKENTGDWFADESMKDKLFDIFMERFDALAPYKKGLNSILKSLPLNPKTALLSKRPFRSMIKDMLELAGSDVSCPKSELKIIGLSLVYLKTVRVWLSDDTDDMAHTMAELDKNLTLAEQFANTLKL